MQGLPTRGIRRLERSVGTLRAAARLRDQASAPSDDNLLSVLVVGGDTADNSLTETGGRAEVLRPVRRLLLPAKPEVGAEDFVVDGVGGDAAAEEGAAYCAHER